MSIYTAIVEFTISNDNASSISLTAEHSHRKDPDPPKSEQCSIIDPDPPMSEPDPDPPKAEQCCFAEVMGVKDCPGRFLTLCRCGHTVCHSHRIVGRGGGMSRLRWWECPCCMGTRWSQNQLGEEPESEETLAHLTGPKIEVPKVDEWVCAIVS